MRELFRKRVEILGHPCHIETEKQRLITIFTFKACYESMSMRLAKQYLYLYTILRILTYTVIHKVMEAKIVNNLAHE